MKIHRLYSQILFLFSIFILSQASIASSDDTENFMSVFRAKSNTPEVQKLLVYYKEMKRAEKEIEKELSEMPPVRRGFHEKPSLSVTYPGAGPLTYKEENLAMREGLIALALDGWGQNPLVGFGLSILPSRYRPLGQLVTNQLPGQNGVYLGNTPIEEREKLGREIILLAREGGSPISNYLIKRIKKDLKITSIYESDLSTSQAVLDRKRFEALVVAIDKVEATTEESDKALRVLVKNEFTQLKERLDVADELISSQSAALKLLAAQNSKKENIDAEKVRLDNLRIDRQVMVGRLHLLGDVLRRSGKAKLASTVFQTASIADLVYQSKLNQSNKSLVYLNYMNIGLSVVDMLSSSSAQDPILSLNQKILREIFKIQEQIVDLHRDMNRQFAGLNIRLDQILTDTAELVNRTRDLQVGVDRLRRQITEFKNSMESEFLALRTETLNRLMNRCLNLNQLSVVPPDLETLRDCPGDIIMHGKGPSTWGEVSLLDIESKRSPFPLSANYKGLSNWLKHVDPNGGSLALPELDPNWWYLSSSYFLRFYNHYPGINKESDKVISKGVFETLNSWGEGIRDFYLSILTKEVDGEMKLRRRRLNMVVESYRTSAKSIAGLILEKVNTKVKGAHLGLGPSQSLPESYRQNFGPTLNRCPEYKTATINIGQNAIIIQGHSHPDTREYSVPPGLQSTIPNELLWAHKLNLGLDVNGGAGGRAGRLEVCIGSIVLNLNAKNSSINNIAYTNLDGTIDYTIDLFYNWDVRSYDKAPIASPIRRKRVMSLRYTDWYNDQNLASSDSRRIALNRIWKYSWEGAKIDKFHLSPAKIEGFYVWPGVYSNWGKRTVTKLPQDINFYNQIQKRVEAFFKSQSVELSYDLTTNTLKEPIKEFEAHLTALRMMFQLGLSSQNRGMDDVLEFMDPKTGLLTFDTLFSTIVHKKVRTPQQIHILIDKKVNLFLESLDRLESENNSLMPFKSPAVDAILKLLKKSLMEWAE